MITIPSEVASEELKTIGLLEVPLAKIGD